MQVNIYIVNSKPGSGKTTFEDECKRYLKNKCEIISSIDFVKQIARVCGWDGSKTPKNRKFLSDLKKLLVEWDDVPIKTIEKEITAKIIEADNYDFDGTLCFFIDIREPDEIEKFKCYFKNACGFNVKTIFIVRDEYEKGNNNNSDMNVENYKYDLYIDNNGSLNDFYRTAQKFLEREDLI